MEVICVQKPFFLAADPPLSKTFGYLIVDRPTRKWFGVNASNSAASLLDAVKSWLFSSFSTEQMTVVNCSSLSDWDQTLFHIAFLHDLTRRSHRPPKCGAIRGLNIVFISNWIYHLLERQTVHRLHQLLLQPQYFCLTNLISDNLVWTQIDGRHLDKFACPMLTIFPSERLRC